MGRSCLYWHDNHTCEYVDYGIADYLWLCHWLTLSGSVVFVAVAGMLFQ